jgi:hypothetical protein
MVLREYVEVILTSINSPLRISFQKAAKRNTHAIFELQRKQKTKKKSTGARTMDR